MKDGLDHWILEGHTPVAVSFEQWMQWMEGGGDRRVALDMVGGKRISTVFLTLDHGFGMSDRPILFETMVFPGDDEWIEERCERYATWDEAEAGHRAIVAELQAELATAE